MATATLTRKPASDKQIALIARLVDEKSLDTAPAHVHHTITLLDERLPITMAAASATIDALFAQPYKQAPAKAAPGYYTRAGEVYVVVANKAGTSTYAKHMQIGTTASGAKKGRWVYAPGVGRTLADLTPLTVEEAARLGHLHGVCMICGAALTDPKSVTAGIGPVCATRL